MPRVLLLEPDNILAKQISKYLKSHKCQTDVCYDAQSAIMSADKNKPDVVIMEMLLVGHSGVEFLYEFRSYSEWQNIPVIVYSRVPHRDLGLAQKQIRDLGIAGILYKSDSTLEKLFGQVEKLLSPVQK